MKFPHCEYAALSFQVQDYVRGGEIRPTTSCLSHGFIWEIYDLIAFSPLFRHIGPKIGHSKNRSRVPCRYVEYCVIITLQIRIVYVLRAYLKRIVLQLGTFNLCNYRQICCKGIQIENLIAFGTPISIVSNF